MAPAKQIRVRFAPSPTGPFHIGSARTALFNWLFAKANNGQFILRVEDTDKDRSKPEHEEDIKMGLEWLGFTWDEFYKQSERTEIYEKYLRELLDKNKLYYCFCSKEDLEAERQAMMSQGIQPKYSGKCSALESDEVEKRLSNREDHVLRFRVPNDTISVKDVIRGMVKFDTTLMGDIIIAKDLNNPLYNFTVVVDDALMEITDVIRGEDHLSNTPKQVLIAEALGFESPRFAHLPIILNPDRSKMSKRFSDTALSDYINQGYLNQAVVNFLAYLGWHPKEDKEIMNIDELVKEFDLGRVQKGGAVFNAEKLEWLNSYYVSHLEDVELIKAASKFVPKEWILTKEIIASVKNRLKKLNEIRELVDFYFELPDYDKELLKWKEMSFEDVVSNLQAVAEVLEGGSVMALTQTKYEGTKVFESALAGLAEKNGKGEIYWPLRVALSGKKASPGPLEIMEALGKEESLERIKSAIKKCAV